ncbi:MAG: hypothetical protein ACTHW2_04315 [Tissierella sp.]|uniref:hypothetical protein n=1 Tax=Tissierella sp. TaxID=41274 RepID=UPI003F98FA8D
MRKKYIDIIIFILTSVSFLISVKLFWNIAIYVDEYGTSPDIIYGGEFWLIMSWARLFILGVLAVFSLVKLFNQET